MSAIASRPALFCVIADRHRDLSVAEDACAGRFTYCGITVELGPTPNWLSAGAGIDPEWRIECSKFLWALDLAHAYATTGEQRFRDAWERLVCSWIAQVPRRADPTEVAARRLQNWVYARESFGPSTTLDRVLLDRLTDEVAYVRGQLTAARNHRTLELYGLLVAALGVPELDSDGSLAEFALAALGENLSLDFHPDGVHREASTHYHALVVRSHLAALANARRFGLEPPPGYEKHLERACQFLRHVTRPDGKLPALSDSDTDDHSDLLELAAALLDNPELRPGTEPHARNVSFPDAGYFIQRSGWFADASYLVFDCGALGDGGHGHYDALAIEVAAQGQPLLVDPGRFTYAEEEPNLRRWFKSTAAHNTVCVDGNDQTPYSRGKPKGPVAVARSGTRTSRAGLDVLRGDVRSPVYDAVHARTILFVDDDWWLIEDRLTSPEPHRYDLRYHLATGDVAVEGRQIVTPSLLLTIAGADELAIERGWIAPRYGVRHAAPVVSAVRVDANARFTTLVVPRRPGVQPPVLRECSLGRAEIEVDGCVDVFTWNADDASRTRSAAA